ncbi:hypothetical protein AB6H14_12780 [Providencia vermicola]
MSEKDTPEADEYQYVSYYPLNGMKREKPAPLQLLPAPNYTSNAHGMAWFSVEKGNADGSDLALPQKGDPFGEIYLNKTLWWRLYESDILDKEEAVSQNNWEEYVILMRKKSEVLFHH